MRAACSFNIDGWTSSTKYIFALDLKIEGFNVASFDAFSTTADGCWAAKHGPTSAGGCGGQASTGFICAEDVGTPVLQATSNSVKWDFTVTFDKDITLADLLNGGNHIGAFFCEDVSECKGMHGLSTGFTTSVPEPSSLILLGMSVLGLTTLRFKKR